MKTAIRQLAQHEIGVEDAAASFQARGDRHLCATEAHCMDMFRRDSPAGNAFVVAGGVAANQAIGEALTR